MNRDTANESRQELGVDPIQALTRLPNGASIISRHRIENPTHCLRWIVLAEYLNQYVTWNCDKDGNAEWGRYYKSLSDAQSDYLNRCGETLV